MDKKINEVIAKTGKILGQGYEVGSVEILRNNGVRVTEIAIKKTGSPCIACIYPQGGYENTEQAAQRVADTYLYGTGINPDTLELFNKDFILKNVVYKVIGKDANAEYLADLYYKDFLDMAVIYRIPVTTGNMEEGSVILTTKQMEGITPYELDQAALENTVSAGIRIGNMNEFLFSAMTAGREPDTLPPDTCILEKDCMYYVTTGNLLFGAGLLLHSGLWDTLSRNAGADLLVLPSSIHEVIVLVDDGTLVPEELKCIVRNINGSDVIRTEDVLTGSVYRWSMSNRRFEIA